MSPLQGGKEDSGPGKESCLNFLRLLIFLLAILLGEISITSNMQMPPPLWQKVEKN